MRAVAKGMRFKVLPFPISFHGVHFLAKDYLDLSIRQSVLHTISWVQTFPLI